MPDDEKPPPPPAPTAPKAPPERIPQVSRTPWPPGYSKTRPEKPRRGDKIVAVELASKILLEGKSVKQAALECEIGVSRAARLMRSSPAYRAEEARLMARYLERNNRYQDRVVRTLQETGEIGSMRGLEYVASPKADPEITRKITGDALDRTGVSRQQKVENTFVYSIDAESRKLLEKLMGDMQSQDFSEFAYARKLPQEILIESESEKAKLRAGEEIIIPEAEIKSENESPAGRK